MKALFLNIIGIGMVLGAGTSMAQYPNMTEEEMAELFGYTEMVPPVEFSKTPAPCEAGDTECEKLYLDVYGEHFQGYMQAQQHPSPIETWESGKCILGENCEQLQDDWEVWVNNANSGLLDFSQGTNPAGNPECITIESNTWFGLDPAYKCYENK